MKHKEPRWVPYGNSFTLVGMHGCISSQDHRERTWVDRLFAILERLMKWRRK